MTEIVTEYNSFWLIIFIFLTIVAIIAGIVIRGKSSNKKDTTIFTKSSDNAKEITLDNNKVHMDTTGKMKSMHDNVVKVDFTSSHEHELDEIEQTIDTHTTQLEQLTLKVEQIDVKVDELLNQFIELKNQNKI